MSYFSSLAVNFGRVATFIQVLFYLPLALDIAGQDAFLALSASLASYYLFLSTVRLLTRGTRLAWIGQTLAVFQFIVIPACLLVCFNVYSPPSATIFPQRRPDSQDKTAAEAIGNLFSRRNNATPSDGLDADQLQSLTGFETLDYVVSASVTFFFWLARRVPGWWHTLLRISSPFFSLLEGVASLLVIQSLASTSRWIIASSLAAPSPRYQRAHSNGAPSARGAAWMSNTFIMRSLASIGFGASEVWQIFFLLVSATIYVTAAFALYVSFDGATKDRPGTAAAIATSVTSTLWLTAIAFAIRKGNVIETSLMFAYVVFNIYQLGPSLSFTPDPISLIRSFKVDTHGRAFVDKLPRSLQAPLTSKILQAASGLVEVIAHWLGQSVDFIHAAGAALPKSVIVSLIYRLMVLYAASRILPMLKGSVAPKHHDEQANHARRASWGHARKRRGGHEESESDTDYSGSSSDSSSHLSASSFSGTEVEELEEEVWDEEEGRWILQRRRLRRRRRRRTPFDGDLDESESDSASDSGEYSEDDSGIAYNDDGTKSIADELKEPMELADTLKSPPPPAPSSSSSSSTAPINADSARKRALNRKRNARRGGSKLGRRGSFSPSRRTTATSPRSKLSDLPSTTTSTTTNSAGAADTQSSPSSPPSTTIAARKRPNLSRPPSSTSRRHKRPRPPSPPSSSSSPSSTPSSSTLPSHEVEAFGSFISILVSYSRLILIAVYSHLLLLDQKNQIYWRFLTVGLTLFLWGLEIVISKEEDVVVGGVGELGTAGTIGRG